MHTRVPLPAVVIGAFLLLAPSTQSAGGGAGTPPPFFCGKTYVVSTSGDLTVAPGPGTVDVLTTHFLDLISFAGNCPPGDASLSMSVALGCDPPPGAAAETFGPFALPEGLTQIPISIAVPDGPPRCCTLEISATVTFSDGSKIAQVSTQTLCVGEAAPGDPSAPRLDVAHVGADAALAHPGDQRSFTYRVTNRDPVHAFDGLVTVDMRNTSGLPEVLAGQDDTAVGVFALSDPTGHDFPIAFADTIPDGSCVPLPEPAHELSASVIQRPITLGPGASADFEVTARTWGLSADGAAGESTFTVTGAFADGTGAKACAGAVLAVDHAQPADLVCPMGAGRAATGGQGAVPGGPAATILLDLPGSTPVGVDFGVDLTSMDLIVDGQPITGGTPNFSGVTQIDGQYVRLVKEFSFITPQAAPDAEIAMVYDLVVEPGAGADGLIDVELTEVTLVADAPTGYANVAPYTIDTVMITDADHVMTPDVEPTILRVAHQHSAVGVEAGTFAQVPMVSLGLDIEMVAQNRYRVTSTWTAAQPGTMNMIGFDVKNDFRGYATTAPPDPCPSDLDDSGDVNINDLLTLIAGWDPIAGFGITNLLDLLGAWGECPQTEWRFSSRIDDFPADFTLADGSTAPTLLHGDVRVRVLDVGAGDVAQVALDDMTFRGESVDTPDGPTGGVSVVLRDPRPATGFWNRETGDFRVDAAFDVHHALIDDVVPPQTPEENADYATSPDDLWTGTLCGTVVENPETGALDFLDGSMRWFLVPSQAISDGVKGAEGGAPPPMVPKSFDPECPEENRTNWRTVCIQPIFINDDDGQNPTGASMPVYQAVADDVYARCCIEFEWREPMFIDSTEWQVIEGPFPPEQVNMEELELLNEIDPFGNDECIELYFVRTFVNPDHGRGAGLSGGLRTSRVKILIQDAPVTACVPPTVTGLAHELGHALGRLPHDVGTIMQPGGDPPNCPVGNPNVITRAQCGKLRNPLIREKDPKETCCLDPDEPE